MCKTHTQKSKYDSTREALEQFHWLPIKQRIDFKIAAITHKCLYGTAPQYLKDLLNPAPTPRNLRSSTDKTRLIVPFTKCKTFAVQSFSISEPSVWNQLPMLLREISNFELFKRQLKTHYYWVAFYWVLHYRNSWSNTAFQFQLTLVIISSIHCNFNFIS